MELGTTLGEAMDPKANAAKARIAELEAEVERREVLFEAARAKLYAARAAVEEAKGDEFQARWYRALEAKDHETADRCYLESQARSVLEGRGIYGEVSEAKKAQIMAEVERLRAEGEATP